jgi:hypothetical protein
MSTMALFVNASSRSNKSMSISIVSRGAVSSSVIASSLSTKASSVTAFTFGASPSVSSTYTTSSCKRWNSNNGLFHKKSLLPFTVPSTRLSSSQTLLYSTITKEEETKTKSIRMVKGNDMHNSSIGDQSAYQLPIKPNKEYSVQVNLPPKQRIVSFGDVHGDIQALYIFLRTANVIDQDEIVDEDDLSKTPQWTGGDTILVQCGDILDRGKEEMACLRVLASLARQADEVGGQVVMLHGNHEALNANGLFHYADPRGNVEVEECFDTVLNQVRKESDGDEDEGVGGLLSSSKGDDGNVKAKGLWKMQYAGNQPTRWAAFEPSGWLAEPLLSNMKVSVVVGQTVFVHAGLTASHLNSYGGIESMNEEASNWFLKGGVGWKNDSDVQSKLLKMQDVIDCAQERARVASESMPESLGGGKKGDSASSPVWMRDYSSPADGVPKNPYAQQMMDTTLSQLAFDTSSDDKNSSNSSSGKSEYLKGRAVVKRMVMGHTPQSKINAALNGKAWRIDVGASKGVMSGTPEVLEIIHQGDENGDDIINILTVNGKKVPAKDRMVSDNSMFFKNF